MNGYCFVFEAS